MKKWITFSKERQGIAHAGEGERPCQDRVCTLSGNGRIIAVLCDGLGAFARSEIAADCVSRRVSSFLMKQSFCPPDLKALRKSILTEAQNAVRETASGEEMDCTLLFAVLIPSRHLLVYGQIGDGAICAMKKSEGILLTPGTEERPAIANMTESVLASDAFHAFHVGSMEGTDLVGVLLTSDGLHNEIYSSIQGVKHNAELYFNFVSSQSRAECDREIGNRWETLSSKAAGAFSDDMSLAVIARKNCCIRLPQDAKWLCVCGARNALESNRCGKCRRDFFTLYDGPVLRGMKEEGEKAFFRRLNENPEEEAALLAKIRKNLSEEQSEKEKKKLRPSLRSEEEKEMTDEKEAAQEEQNPSAPSGRKGLFSRLKHLFRKKKAEKAPEKQDPEQKKQSPRPLDPSGE